MILPIVAYGSPVLKASTQEVDKNYPQLKELIANMFETMYNAKGVGLAAPQIGLSLRLFIVDSKQILDDVDEAELEAGEEKEEGIKEVFINAQIIEKGGQPWLYNEGCLSIPGINEDVMRDEIIKIQYYDADFNLNEKTFEGLNARVILHEYDHIEGILFLDYLSGLKRRLLQRKLEKIMKGNTSAQYRMSFPKAKKRR